MNPTNTRERYLLVAVLPDESLALRAYRLLQQGGISPANIAIVGRGYRDCDAVGFAQPLVVSRQRAYWTAALTGVIGVVMGVVFQVITAPRFEVIPGNPWANWAIAAVAAGLSGAMGGFFVGGGVGYFSESGESLSYRVKVDRGKYLILVEGPESLVEESALLLETVSESTQRYYFRPSAVANQ
ncbi:hypothetical protein [Candidatus Cyanaurora vandensis]|uniref:hypothetical protein n=1 Tax=Candidatus Cyanaurora vandensis TaxID=2714958 RepID=UPI00257FCD6D|nr:hypothetical protein [Candidatus Cyanaurora vandensis]